MEYGNDLGLHHGTADFGGWDPTKLISIFSGAGQKAGSFLSDNPEAAAGLFAAGAGVVGGLGAKRRERERAELEAQLNAERMRIEEARRKANLQLVVIGIPLIALVGVVMVKIIKKE